MPRTVSVQSRWLQSAAIRLTSYALIAYLTIGAFFYFRQARLLFPAPNSFQNVVPATIGLKFEDVAIAVHPQHHLHAWWIPAAVPTDKALLVFHGNGYVLEDMVGNEIASLHQLRANLLLVDYRGYGLSTPITPNETTINEDAEASLHYLQDTRNIPAANVFVLGRSIGSGPATYLALHNSRLAGLILESPFSSIDDASAGFWYFRIYPTALLLRSHFDNFIKMANKLFTAAQQPKQLYLVPGAGHDDLLDMGGIALQSNCRGSSSTHDLRCTDGPLCPTRELTQTSQGAGQLSIFLDAYRKMQYHLLQIVI